MNGIQPPAPAYNAKSNFAHSSGLSRLHLLSGLLRWHERQVQRHHSRLKLADSSLRSLLLFLPNRRVSHEVVELLYSFCNLLGLSHDFAYIRLLRRYLSLYCSPDERSGTAGSLAETDAPNGAVAAARRQHASINETAHKKILAAAVSTPPAQLLPLTQLLSALTNTQLVFEMIAHRYHSNAAAVNLWLLVIEGIKLLLRLFLLFLTRGRPLVQSIPQRDDEVLQLLPSTLCDANTEFTELVALSTEVRKRETLIDRLNTDEGLTVAGAKAEVNGANATASQPVHIAGEVLHHLRPIVYLLAQRQFGDHSWKAWWLSLAVDICSRKCAGDLQWATSAERAAILRRTRLWLLYFLRAPMRDYVGQLIKTSRLRHVPLLSSAYDIVTAFTEHFSSIEAIAQD